MNTFYSKKLFGLFVLLVSVNNLIANEKTTQRSATLNQETSTNLAMLSTVTVSTSFVSGWESLAAINDGNAPTSSSDRTYPIYGNWNGDQDYGKYNWVQYEWPTANKISSLSVFWFTDFGGLMQPSSAYIEYWDGISWVNAGQIGLELDKFNTLNTTFTSRKVRLYMKSSTSTGIAEFKVMGTEVTGCNATALTPYTKINTATSSVGNCANVLIGDSVTFSTKVDDTNGNASNGKWGWSGPNNFSSSSPELKLSNIQKNQSGTYTAVYVNDCGTTTNQYFYLTASSSSNGDAYSWPSYSPTLKYHFRQEYPSLTMPTQDLSDCSNVAGTMSSGWWTFKWGPNKRSTVTTAAITEMLNKMNTDFAYIRDTMGWPPDKRAKNGYRSAIYLYGSGLSTDNADSTALGGWQGAIDYQGQSWPMVLLSYLPVSCFDPAYKGSDKEYQTNAVVHEGIHAILADLPGCKNAAWFQEGGNTWLQQEMAATRSKDYSSMGFLNVDPYIAPFMPIECYSGWLQDDSFGGPSAEGVNQFNGTQQVCTWRNLLGGNQYGNTFPVFLGEVLGKGSIPWIWRYCPNRVLDGIADTLGAIQTRRLIMEYRTKQALLDMGPWTSALSKLLDANMKVSIKAEWQPSWLNPAEWLATPYAKTTQDASGYLAPEYRTTPGWSGANQIPLHVSGDLAVVNFLPLGDNMSCQLCYRTATGETVYSEPVFGGDCKLKIDPLKKPANGVIFAVICNTNYIYEGEETRKAHYDYRLKLGQGVLRTADIYKKWYNWTSVITDPSLDVREITAQNGLDVKVYPNPLRPSNLLVIEVTHPEPLPVSIKFTNISGQIIYTSLLNENRLTLPKDLLPQGLYIVSIKSGSEVVSQKIIVE